MQVFYRGGVAEEAVKVATWIRGNGEEKPVLTVEDSKGYEEVKKIHNLVCDKLNRSDIRWEVAVESMASIH